MKSQTAVVVARSGGDGIGGASRVDSRASSVGVVSDNGGVFGSTAGDDVPSGTDASAFSYADSNDGSGRAIVIGKIVSRNDGVGSITDES